MLVKQLLYDNSMNVHFHRPLSNGGLQTLVEKCLHSLYINWTDVTLFSTSHTAWLRPIHKFSKGNCNAECNVVISADSVTTIVILGIRGHCTHRPILEVIFNYWNICKPWNKYSKPHFSIHPSPSKSTPDMLDCTIVCNQWQLCTFLMVLTDLMSYVAKTTNHILVWSLNWVHSAPAIQNLKPLVLIHE